MFLIQPVIGGFLGDDDVVNVAFSQSRLRYFNKSGFLNHFRNGFTTDVTHAGFKPADELKNTCGK